MSWSATGSSTLGGTGTWDTSSAFWWDGASAIVWTDTTGTADTAVFGGTAGTVTLNSLLGALRLQFLITGYTFETGSNTFSLGTGGIDASSLTSGTTTISGNLSLVGAQSWNTGAGSTLAVSATIATGGNTLTVNGAGTTTLSGIVSGTGSLTQSGSGTLTLTGDNTYSGATTVNAGTLQIGNGTTGSIAAGSAVTVASGATLGINLASAGTFANTVANSGTVNANGANANTLSSAISGTGAFTKSGAGTTTLSGANTYTGATTVNAGTLQIGNGTTGSIVAGSAVTVASGATLGINLAAAGTFASPVANSGTVNANGANANTISSVISGTGTFIQSGAGTTTLSGASTYSGGTTLNAGQIKLGVNSVGAGNAVTSGALGTGTVTLSGGTLQMNNKTLGNNLFSTASTSTIIDNVTNNGTLTGLLSGSGTITLQNSSGNNLSMLVGTGADVDWSGFSGTFNYVGAIGNNKNLNFFTNNTSATGGLNLSNANVVFSNATNNAGSSMRISAGGTTKLGALSGVGYIQNNGILEVGNKGTDTSFTGVISMGGSLTKTGAGAFTLSGTSTYTGTTTVRQGSLIAGGNAAVSTNGAFGTAASAIALGDATSISSNLSPSLLTGGAFTVARAITVGSSNTATTGVYTIGGNTANSSTFSGATTLNQNLSVTQVSGGTLTLSGIATSGSSGTQTLTFNNVGSVTDSGVIGGGTGTLAVTQAGAGTTTLTGTNTYTGATSITGGTLLLSGTGSINGTSGITINGSGAKFAQTSSVAVTPAITVTQGTLDGTGTVGDVTMGNGTGAFLANGNGIATTKLTLNSLTFTGGASTINLRFDGTLGFSVTNALTTAGTITVNSTGFAWANGTTYNIISYGGGSAVSLSNFASGSLGLTSRQSGTWGMTGTNLTLSVAGDSPKWTGVQSSEWTTNTIGGSSNWKLITGGTVTDYIASDTVLFDDSATNKTVDLSTASVAPTSVIFNNSTGNDYTLTSSGAYGITAGNLIKNGTGVVILANTSGTNTYSGTTTINAGTLRAGAANAFSPNSAITLANTAGATLDLNSFNNTIGSLAGGGTSGGNVTLGGGNTLTTGDNNLSTTFAGVISDGGLGAEGNLTKNGTGTFTLTGTNTYIGTTTINAGTLEIGNGTTDGFIATSGNIVDNAALAYNLTSSQGYTGVISGTGTLAKNGAGTLTLSGANTYTGATTINGGTLQIGDGTGGSISAGSVLTVASGATLAFDEAADSIQSNAIANSGTVTGAEGSGITNTLSGVISGTGAFIQSGAGTTVLSGINTYSGGTTVNAGTLTLTRGGAAGTVRGTLTINSGATVNLTAQDTLGFGAGTKVDTVNIVGGTLNNAVNFNNGYQTNFVLTGGTMAETVASTGTVGFNFDAANGYGITTNASATTSTISSRLTIRSGTLNFNVADGAASTDLNVSGVILVNGGTGISKSGAGTMVLAGANTYTGTTTVNAGILALGAANSIASSSGLVLNGGTFATGGFSQTLNTLTLSSSSTLDFGSGTSALAFADSNSVTWTGLLTLLNFDVGTDTLKFSTSAGLTATQLSQLSLAGYTAALDTNGFVTFSAIPEPAAYVAIFGGLALIGATIIRRRREQAA
ncbi:MAG: autotransporter-associated beta strand repeat-containing protein [Verrucomicrobia bacterium]|nr:autotransporter-associated beta strand repeat-containing protein [Verrucomicrobiota bacterium]